MFLFIVIAGVLLLVTHQLVTYIQVRRFKRRHGCQPAVVWPQRDPLLGLDIFWTIKNNARLRIGLEENTKACFLEGRTRTFSTMGQSFVTTCDPENVRALLAVQFHDFGLGSRIRALGPLLGSGIFTSDDKHWEHSRALIRPSFTRAQVADLDCVESHLQNLLHRLPSNGTTVDLQPLFFNFTIDNSTEFLLGHSVNCQVDDRMRHFSESFDYAESILQDRMRLGKLAFLQRDAKFTESCRIVHDFIDDYIAKALNATDEHGVKTAALKTKRYNLLSSLAEACRDPVQLRNELLNVLLAARDTTAGLLSSVFYFLARHPDVWRELEAEVHELGGVPPDYDTIKGMKYLRSVIDETLRLHPPVPLNIRYARRNTTLPRGGGPDGQAPVFVAQGTAVHYSAWTMHRLPDVFGPDADAFRPARWHGDNGPNGRPLRPGWAYLPFNGGPRVCLGQQSALVEASYVVVRLVQEFERIEARGGVFRENIGLTLSHHDGVKLALWRRDEQ